MCYLYICPKAAKKHSKEEEALREHYSNATKEANLKSSKTPWGFPADYDMYKYPKAAKEHTKGKASKDKSKKHSRDKEARGVSTNREIPRMKGSNRSRGFNPPEDYSHYITYLKAKSSRSPSAASDSSYSSNSSAPERDYDKTALLDEDLEVLPDDATYYPPRHAASTHERPPSDVYIDADAPLS